MGTGRKVGPAGWPSWPGKAGGTFSPAERRRSNRPAPKRSATAARAAAIAAEMDVRLMAIECRDVATAGAPGRRAGATDLTPGRSRAERGSVGPWKG